MGFRAVHNLVLSGPFNFNTLQPPETFFYLAQRTWKSPAAITLDTAIRSSYQLTCNGTEIRFLRTRPALPVMWCGQLWQNLVFRWADVAFISQNAKWTSVRIILLYVVIRSSVIPVVCSLLGNRWNCFGGLCGFAKERIWDAFSFQLSPHAACCPRATGWVCSSALQHKWAKKKKKAL